MSLLATPAARGGRLARFGVVGLANTAVGYATILAGLAAGQGNVQASLVGYAIGLAVSFVLNSRWTFGAQIEPRTAMRYGLVFAAAFSVNVAVMQAGLLLGLPAWLAHLGGVASYSICFYLGLREIVFRQRDRQAGAGLVDAPVLLLILCWAALAVALHDIPVSHDVVWQLWVARQLLGGAELYRDIVELNPPLWFWMALPVQALAEALSLQARQMMIGAVFAWSGLSLVAIALLHREADRSRRNTVLFASLAAMTVVAMPDFAQREHLALIAALPYAFLLARRVEGQPVALPLAAVIALAAAAGFALKHYFILVPLLLELWLALRMRRNWTPFRPETVVLAAAAIAYGAAVLILTPEFLDRIVPLVSLAYHGYERPLWMQITSQHVLAWILCGAALFTLRPLPPTSIALILSAAGFIVSYAAQAKGWSYHAMPATGSLFVALAVAAHARLGGVAEILRARPFVAAVAVAPLIAAVVAGPYANASRDTLTPELRRIEAGSSVMAIVANPSRVWPMVDDDDYVWPSRHFTYWMLPAIAMDRFDPAPDDPRLVALATQIRRDTVEDMRCLPPAAIVVSTADSVPSLRAYGFDIMSFLREDAELGAILDQYEGGRAGLDMVLFRKPDWSAPMPGEACRAIR